jgi:hypothetical protein
MSSLTKIIKDLESFIQDKLSYCRQQSFQQCNMGAKESADRRNIDDSMNSKKDECISD